MGVTLQNTITQQLILLLWSPFLVHVLDSHLLDTLLLLYFIEVTHLSLNSVGIQPMTLRQ